MSKENLVIVEEQRSPEPVPMDQDEFLAKKDCSFIVSGFEIDKIRCNRQLRTENGRKRFLKECDDASRAYHEKRREAIKEYNQLVSDGRIRPRTSLERSLITAHGNPDNSATQAARRMCAKRGYDWKTGCPLKMEEK